MKVGQKTENDRVIYRFGPFELDTRAGELRRNDKRIALTPKVFQLVVLLVENPGTLITKHEFLDKIWGESDAYPNYEGRTGASPREVKTLILNAAQNPKFACLSPLAVFDEHNAYGNFTAIHSALDHLRPHELPPFRVVDDRTRQASLQPVKAGAIIFNLPKRRIVQIQNTFSDVQRMGVQARRLQRAGWQILP